MTSTEFTPGNTYDHSDYAMTNRFLARRYFNNRGANGRFTKRVHVDEVRFTGGSFYTDEKGMSHGHANCGDARGAMVAETNASGWLCSTCVHVPVPTQVLAEVHEVVSRTGSQECLCCRLEKKVTAFPTVLVPGALRHRGDVCRSCERDRRTGTPGGFVPEC